MNILVFLHSRKHFGAQIVHIPALQAIRHKHPNAKLVAVAKFDHAKVLQELGYIDELHLGTGFGFLREVATSREFDSAYSFRPTSFTADLVLCSAFIKKRFSFTKPVINLCQHVKYGTDNYRAKSFFSLVSTVSNDYQNSCNKIREPYLDSSKDIVILVPGAGGKEKRWPLTRFFQLAELIKSTTNLQPLFILGPEEKEEEATLRNYINYEYLVSPNLKQLFTIIANSSIMVSADCGPAHIAHIMNKNQIVLFNEILPEWFDFRSNSVPLSSPLGVKGIAQEVVISHIKSKFL